MTIFPDKDIFNKSDYQLININHLKTTNLGAALDHRTSFKVYFPVPKSFFTKKLSINELLQQLSSAKTKSNPVLEAKTLNAKNTKNDPSLGRYSKFSTPKSF